MSLEEIQLGKANRLLAALESNLFYREKLDGLGAVESLAEFSEKVPFTTKSELAANQLAPSAIWNESNLAGGEVFAFSSDERNKRSADDLAG